MSMGFINKGASIVSHDCMYMLIFLMLMLMLMIILFLIVDARTDGEPNLESVRAAV